jgi:hypothetical protein
MQATLLKNRRPSDACGAWAFNPMRRMIGIVEPSMDFSVHNHRRRRKLEEE